MAIIRAARISSENHVIGQKQEEVLPETQEDAIAGPPPELQAELLLVEARREADAIRQSAYDDGYREGMARARQEVQEEWAFRVEDLVREAQGLSNRHDALIAEAEEDLVRLALAIASKVLRYEAKTEPSYLRTLARAALERLIGRSRIRLFLNPEDHARYQEGAFSLSSEGVILPVADPSVGAGGCRIETECGRADATFFQQMAEIACSLLPDPGFAELAVDDLEEFRDPREAGENLIPRSVPGLPPEQADEPND